MRAREFLMMDAYSFDIDIKSSTDTYNSYYSVYLKIFKRIGLVAIPMQASTGAIGGSLSHEFHVLAENGESSIFYDKRLNDLISNSDGFTVEQMQHLYAKADEEHDPLKCILSPDQLEQKRGIEVGHIFHFGDKYSKTLNATVLDKHGNAVFPIMGSYGIGVGRLICAAIESSNDKDGIIWHPRLSPFDVMLVCLDLKKENVVSICDAVYNDLSNAKIDVLYDDTDASVGVKLNTADLIGIPYQIIIGSRSIGTNMCEVKERRTGKKVDVSLSDVVGFVTQRGFGSFGE